MLHIKFEEINVAINSDDDDILEFTKNYITPCCSAFMCEDTLKDNLFIDKKVFISKYGKDYKHVAMRHIKDYIFGLIILTKKYIFFHAAGFTYKDKAFIILGSKGSGKSSFLIDALIAGEVDYLSNDVVIYNIHTGFCYGWPKAPSIRYQTYEKYPILKNLFVESLKWADEYPFTKNTRQEFIDSKIIDKDSSKVRVSPINFAKMFSSRIMARAEIGCFILPSYQIGQSASIVKLENKDKKKEILLNLSDNRGVLGEKSKEQLLHFSYENSMLGKIPMYRVVINENNYVEAIMMLMGASDKHG
jgi:hypothetical protein